MAKGPYTIYGMPMFLWKWALNFELKDTLLIVLPVWIQLSFHLWGERSIAKIASIAGKPVVIDECTAKKLRLSYACALVEVDITKL